MAANDDAAQKARADRLKGRVEQLKTDSQETDPSAEQKPAATPENPRDFIQRRMREIQEQKRS